MARSGHGQLHRPTNTMIQPPPSLTLPASERATPIATPAGWPAESEDDLRYSAIYLIDPNPGEYRQIDTGLDTRRVRVETFTTAGAALRVPVYQAPLFYIVNVRLDEMSGFDLREMLTDRWPRVPGYMISDAYNPEDELRARCAGATLYFCKPLSAGWLASAVKDDLSGSPPVLPGDEPAVAWRRPTPEKLRH